MGGPKGGAGGANPRSQLLDAIKGGQKLKSVEEAAPKEAEAAGPGGDSHNALLDAIKNGKKLRSANAGPPAGVKLLEKKPEAKAGPAGGGGIFSLGAMAAQMAAKRAAAAAAK